MSTPRPVPPHRRTSKRTTALTPPEIERIAKVYVETLSISAVCRALGHDFNTVRKYVEDGDPGRNIPSIKSTLAKRAREFAAEPPAKRIEYSVHQAFESSTNTLRLVKSLFTAKFATMLREFDDAMKSGDAARIAAVQAKIFPHIKIADVPRVMVAEAVLFEKMGPKEQGGGAHAPPPPDVDDEVADLLDDLTAMGVVVQDADDPAHTDEREPTEGDDDSDEDDATATE